MNCRIMNNRRLLIGLNNNDFGKELDYSKISSETGYGYAIQIVNNLGISCRVSVLVRQTEFPFRSLWAVVSTT